MGMSNDSSFTEEDWRRNLQQNPKSIKQYPKSTLHAPLSPRDSSMALPTTAVSPHLPPLKRRRSSLEGPNLQTLARRKSSLSFLDPANSNHPAMAPRNRSPVSVNTSPTIFPRPPYENAYEIGDYEVTIGAEIGCGGYSAVFQATDTRTNQKYALKRVKFAHSVEEDIRKNLLDEVKTLTRLRGVKHVISLLAYDTSQSHDRIEMLMELGQGDLYQILQSLQTSQTVPTTDFIRYWGGQVLQAVAEVHKHNIVHADLKPANFVIVNGSLKLIDFGLANPVPLHTASIHRITPVGTVMYMAPETTVQTLSAHLRGSASSTAFRVTKASDVWSCGVILYEMLYQRFPYNPATYLNDAQLGTLEEVQHPRRTSYNMAVPLALHEVIWECLQLDVGERCTAEKAAKSLFFAPVSVDLKALFDIAYAVRTFTLNSLNHSGSSKHARNGAEGAKEGEGAKDGAKEGATMESTNQESTNQESASHSGSSLSRKSHRDGSRRRDFEKFVGDLYRKLKSVNVGSRYDRD